uniref:Reverse transcriptase domain-containing protein n=1 Tax=Octopus bimaculoides TaxID=37653 RepID=A0A0L8IDQ5_OCTBM
MADQNRMHAAKLQERHTNDIRWNLRSTLEDHDFMDDVALISYASENIQDKTHRLPENAEKIGLNFSPEKCKTLWNNDRHETRVRIGENEVEDIDEFAYLRATMKKDGKPRV